MNSPWKTEDYIVTPHILKQPDLNLLLKKDKLHQEKRESGELGTAHDEVTRSALKTRNISYRMVLTAGYTIQIPLHRSICSLNFQLQPSEQDHNTSSYQKKNYHNLQEQSTSTALQGKKNNIKSRLLINKICTQFTSSCINFKFSG